MRRKFQDLINEGWFVSDSRNYLWTVLARFKPGGGVEHCTYWSSGRVSPGQYHSDYKRETER